MSRKSAKPATSATKKQKQTTTSSTEGVMYNKVLSRVCQKLYKRLCISVSKIESYMNYCLNYLLCMNYLLYIWIRKPVLKEFWMGYVQYRIQERDVLQ